MSPNKSISEEIQSAPLHASTPAPDNLQTTAATAVVSSTPVTHGIKKALFNTPPIPASTTDKSAITSPPQLSSPRSKRPSRRSSRQRSVTTTEYSDCFGFDENDSRNKKAAVILHKVSRSSLQPSKVDYERQSSLLSFGSVSLSQYDDVFSQPPDIQQQTEHAAASTSSMQKENAVSADKINDYSGFSDSDLSAPGFKVSSKVRKQAEKARRIGKAGSTPGHRKRESSNDNSNASPRRKKRESNNDNLNASPRSTRQSARIRGSSPEINPLNKDGNFICSPKSNKSKRPRVEMVKTIKSPHLPHAVLPLDPLTLSSPLPFRARTPKAAKEMEIQKLRDKDVNSSQNISIGEEVNQNSIWDFHEEEDYDHQSTVSTTPSYKSLTDSARDLMVRYKYNYKVSSCGPGAKQTQHTKGRTKKAKS